MHRLILCCDANAESGLGHFSRCQDLALALQAELPDWELVFLGNYAEHAASALHRAGFRVQSASGSTFSTTDLAALLVPSAAVLVDSYLAGPAFYAFLNQSALRWAAFDDLETHDFAGAELVINARMRAEQLLPHYRAARSALGPRFMPIHPELGRVREQREALPIPPRVENIVVFVGGSDLYGVGPGLSRVAWELFPGAAIRLVESVSSDAELPRNVARLPLQPSLMPLLTTADLLLSGGGRLKYEAGFALVANAALNQTALQAADTAVLAALGVTLDLGRADRFDAAALERRLEPLVSAESRSLMRERQRAEFPQLGNRPLLALVREALAPRSAS